jgi:phospholipid/cholesterol/gamma-HCH transport system substrate-binding protein
MKKERQQETTIEVIVGFFFAMMIVALFFGTAILSRTKLFGGGGHKYEVVFEHVMGLRKGDNVFVRGVDVGKVDRLAVKADGAHVYCSLETPIQLHADYKVEVLPSSVLGGRYLAIELGSNDKPELRAGAVLRGLTPVDLIDEATRTVSLIKKNLEDGKMLENLAATLADVKKITTKLAAGEGTLGRLLMEDHVYNDLKVTTANLKDISHRLAAGESTLGKLLAKDDTLYRDVAAAATSLKNIAGKIEKGEGTIGKLTQDDGLYQDVKKTMNEARAAIDDFREYAPLATFSSLFMGAF